MQAQVYPSTRPSFLNTVHSQKPEWNHVIYNLFPVFKHLRGTEKEEFESKLISKKAIKHEFIYHQGDPGEYVYFVEAGIVKIGNVSGPGREVIRDLVYPGFFFGEGGLSGASKHEEFAQVMKHEVKYWMISKGVLEQMMQRNHKLCLEFMSLIGSKLRDMERRLESMIIKDSRSRILEFIKECGLKRGKPIGLNERLFKHCLTHQDIANYTGTCRQTVTSVLNELKKENTIHVRSGCILIRDIDKLV